MFRFNGIGTTIIGKKDFDPTDRSYTTTKWFTVLFIPVVPLGSYRVIRVDKGATAKWWQPVGDPQYQMQLIAFETGQAVRTFLTWSIPVAVILYLLGIDISSLVLGVTVLFVIGSITAKVNSRKNTIKTARSNH